MVLDINVPEMNGIEAASQIKLRAPEPGVIGLSVNAGVDNRAARLEAGAADLLTKNAVEALDQAIQQALKPRAPARTTNQMP